MSKLDQLKETCITLGITIPFVVLSMGTALPAPREGEKESKLKNNIESLSEVQEDNRFAGRHINTHVNKIVNGNHTDKHTNTSPYRELV